MCIMYMAYIIMYKNRSMKNLKKAYFLVPNYIKLNTLK